MQSDPGTMILLLLGAAAGVLSGCFGIGGGAIIVPALVYLLGFSQHKATGTSLAILLPPVGLAAVIEYYRQGNVDLRVAALVALGLFAGGWFGSLVAQRLSAPSLRLAFGLFVMSLGASMVYRTLRHL